jgi:hypothetical protein
VISRVARGQLGFFPNMIQPPLFGAVNAASAVSAQTLTCRAPPVTARITLCKPAAMADNWSNKEEDGHASHRRSGSSL